MLTDSAKVGDYAERKMRNIREVCKVGLNLRGFFGKIILFAEIKAVCHAFV